MRAHRVRMGVAACIVAVLAAVGVRVLHFSSQVSYQAVDRARVAFYKEWYHENKDAYEAWVELARQKGWSMYVWAMTGGRDFMGIGRLDWGKQRYSHLYGAPGGRGIGTVTPFHDGRAAFIESTCKWSRWRSAFEESEYELGVVESDKTVRKIPFEPADEFVGAVGLGERYVFFAGNRKRAWLYDIQEKTLLAAPEVPRRPQSIAEVSILRDKFLLLLYSEPNGHMVVVDIGRPQDEVSGMDDVSQMLLVGEHVIIEKGDACFFYEPRTGAAEQLTPGKLVTAAANDGFLFYSLEQESFPLYRYTISSRSAELLWEPREKDTGFRIPPGEGKAHEYSKIILSPCGRFLFVPWRLERPRSKAEWLSGKKLEYEVYDIMTGEKCGAFLNLYKGKFFFEFLGWEETD